MVRLAGCYMAHLECTVGCCTVSLECTVGCCTVSLECTVDCYMARLECTGAEVGCCIEVVTGHMVEVVLLLMLGTMQVRPRFCEHTCRSGACTMGWRER